MPKVAECQPHDKDAEPEIDIEGRTAGPQRFPGLIDTKVMHRADRNLLRRYCSRSRRAFALDWCHFRHTLWPKSRVAVSRDGNHFSIQTLTSFHPAFNQALIEPRAANRRRGPPPGSRGCWTLMPMNVGRLSPKTVCAGRWRSHSCSALRSRRCDHYRYRGSRTWSPRSLKPRRSWTTGADGYPAAEAGSAVMTVRRQIS